MMKVSVIIPFYNAEGSIQNALISALSQTILPNKIVIVNDCSSTISHNDLHSLLLNSTPIHLRDMLIIRTLYKNMGPSVARNYGMLTYNADIFLFLDADDYMDPIRIEETTKFFRNYPNATLMTGKMLDMDSKSFHANPVEVTTSVKEIYYRDMLIRNYFSTSAVAYKPSELILFDNDLRYCEDYDLWLRNSEKGFKLYVFSEILGYRSAHNFLLNGLSRDINKMIYSRVVIQFKSIIRTRKYIYLLLLAPITLTSWVRLHALRWLYHFTLSTCYLKPRQTIQK